MDHTRPLSAPLAELGARGTPGALLLLLLLLSLPLLGAPARARPVLDEPAATAPAPRIPLCAGLTVVTAISQPSGDYESIKTIESVSADAVQLKYSSEAMHQDLFSAEPPALRSTNVVRRIRTADLREARNYLQQFFEVSPEEVPETTAIGTSTAVLRALKTSGSAELGIFSLPDLPVPLDRSGHPNVYDYILVARLERQGDEAVRVPVLVDDRVVDLPAIRATGDFFGDRAEFFFLDDEDNPLTLKFRIGIGGIVAYGPDPLTGVVPPPRDRDTLEVVKISTRCLDAGSEPSAGSGAGVPAGGGPLPDGASQLERELAESGEAVVYDIHFSFDSHQLRVESEPRLREIAAVMARHPDWRLSVNGHTDAIASDQYNLDLSRRRAAAVKSALVERHGVGAGRLVTAGFGEGAPRDTNDTLAGRARNRRVELIRLR